MESTNLHQLQEQPPPVEEASSLSTPSCYRVGSSSHSWTPNVTLNVDNLNPNLQEVNARSRASTHKNDPMIQDLGYNLHHWTRTSELAESCLLLTTTSKSYHDLDQQFSSIKEETSYWYGGFPKFSEIPISPNSSMEGHGFPSTTHMKKNNEHKDVSEKLLHKTLLSGDFYTQNDPSFGVPLPSRGGNFSLIYPSINISNLNQAPPSPSSAISQHLGLGILTENLMQHPIDRSSSCNNSNSIIQSYFTNGMAETKRPSTLVESKASQPQTTLGKSRLKLRPSCPPLKVRKEKLGDRIAALQQLVAPFGKTDTASVLMEAIGYIKFLQSQVETLSVPYMKSSRNQTKRVMQGGSAIDNPNVEPKQDLRSRGLCLVPLSCMSYIAGEGASGRWQHPNFGGAT